MCDKELLLGYLYDDVSAADRKAFDAHLAACAECRDELAGLRGTRTSLMSWAPPDPDLGFHIVRSAKPAPARAAWWRVSPAWGLAAAALLTLAVSAAVANLEVKVGAEGLVVRTGWGRSTDAATSQATAIQAASTSALEKVEARVKELEGQLAARQAATITPATTTSVNRMSDAEVVRLVRQLVNESEQRQQGMLATKILQVSRDTEAARRNDVDRLLTAYRQLQGASYDTSQRLRAFEDHLVRVGLQR